MTKDSKNMFSKRDTSSTNENPLSEVIRSGSVDSMVKKGGDDVSGSFVGKSCLYIT